VSNEERIYPNFDKLGEEMYRILQEFPNRALESDMEKRTLSIVGKFMHNTKSDSLSLFGAAQKVSSDDIQVVRDAVVDLATLLMFHISSEMFLCSMITALMSGASEGEILRVIEKLSGALLEHMKNLQMQMGVEDVAH